MLDIRLSDVIELLLDYRSYIRSKLGLDEAGVKRRFGRRRGGPEDLRNIVITLTMIANNLRPLDSIECVRLWLENPGSREFWVGPYGAKCVIPRIIDEIDYRVTKATGLPSIHAISKWIVRVIGLNSTTLRRVVENEAKRLVAEELLNSRQKIFGRQVTGT
jgi:hypothetical protein